jgi:glycerophosphoryl diester phosphodiesterase
MSILQKRCPWLSIFCVMIVCAVVSAGEEAIPVESPEAGIARHQRVSERRKGIQIICHRGSAEFAHENTLEAYRASFDLGADGNEIDIRATKDGILICFHDDMLDQLLEAYGDTSDYAWDQLRRFRFRAPEPFGKDCRIPTLVEVLDLHRQQAGLVYLDIKRPELVQAVMELVDRMDMWDHVVAAPAQVTDRRYTASDFKGSLYENRGDVDRDTIATVLNRSGNSVIVDDPRGVAVFLQRMIQRPSNKPVAPVDIPQVDAANKVTSRTLLDTLRDADDWNQIPRGEQAEVASSLRIVHRAEAADRLGDLEVQSPEMLDVLRQRVENRSLHPNWRYHGLDGAAALRALIQRRDPRNIELARFCLWRDDPACESLINPQSSKPRSWVDWRTKVIVFRELAKLPGSETERLCRDYLALSDAGAEQIGVPQFEAAAKALLNISAQEDTAIELLKHRRSDVRGRAILICVAHANEQWAERALSQAAPHALAYVLK